ncbi:DNA-directed RNA polymerases I, II, and III subunit RPABC3, variant 2 [Entomophthora muscae]|uniref:DNA-directed RNA polymerases I, II, and III subunit RPABC3, variant 2 n=1 Tax=Entomophthora muscae TaxID=34485 RepID=A0ACC2UTP6_9FUNG|nr:DNA-directed RNA polymerases I, II, and III subunit RPABC3, variant 2 [Entomophthora muscae]
MPGNDFQDDVPKKEGDVAEDEPRSKLLSELDLVLKESPFWVKDGLIPSLLFGERFEVDNIDKDKKKFDKVSRLEATSLNYKMSLVLDYNSELLRITSRTVFFLGLAASLSDTEPVSKDPNAYLQPASWNEGQSTETAKRFSYVAYGKVYRYEKAEEDKMIAYISFGGLLMSLTGYHYQLEMCW